MNAITHETRQLSFEDTLAKAPHVRDLVYAILAGYGSALGLTAEDVAARLNKPAYQVRPRLTELLEQGKIHVIGKRRSHITGKMIAVYRVASWPA